MTPPRRGLARVAVVASLTLAPIFMALSSAEAHPLGNATINHYDGLTLQSNRVDNFAVEDVAEIPTVGRQSAIDTDGNGQLSDSERAKYAGAQCDSLVTGVRLTVGGADLAWTVLSSEYTQRPGAAGLPIGRLECRLTATADLTAATSVTLNDSWDGAGIGWHEITAVGQGTTLVNSPVPAASVSETLLKYPNDMLSSPLDVRAATLRVTPGGGMSTYVPTKAGSQANWAVRWISQVTTRLNDLIKGRLDFGVGLLAVLLSILLGAGHAMLPGHGKTIMAAYLVGKRGRLRDVVTVGATVTITHTAGVLILGMLISLSARFAPTAVEQSLAVISGLIVVLVGVGLLISALRSRSSAGATVDASIAAIQDADPSFVVPEQPLFAAAAAGSRPLLAIIDSPPRGQRSTERDHGPSGHDHGPSGHDHAHAPSGDDHAGAGGEAPHSHGWFGGGHSHGPGSGHDHAKPEGFSRKGLIGLGAAGGLVPSPSALLVLLATIALGRTAFGVLLVLAYGLGMAGALTAAGLLLVKLRNRLATFGAGRFRRLSRLAAIMPIVTATLVIVVGLALAARSFGGSL